MSATEVAPTAPSGDERVDRGGVVVVHDALVTRGHANGARGSRPCDRVRSFRAASQLLSVGDEPGTCTCGRLRGERGADDAREVAELGHAHLAVGVDAIEELVGVLHDAAADHDEIGP